MPQEEEYPQTISGHFELGEQLGQGGMGIVFRCRDQVNKVDCAIKFLSSERLSSASAIDRFIRESAVASRLEHPNIVRIIDAGVENDFPYMIMELCVSENGRSFSLEDLQVQYENNDYRLPPGVLLRLLPGLLSGISFLHENGIIHRDLKPANVLLLQDGNKLTPKLSDFGLAAITADTHAAEQYQMSVALSRQGTSARDRAQIGTYKYMSPEQRQGTSLTAASDVYSLGLIVYLLATGFERLNPEMPGELDSRYPSWFDAWLEKALAENPAARYPNATTMLAASPLTPTIKPISQSSESPRRFKGIYLFAIAIAALAAAFRYTPQPVQDEWIRTIATVTSAAADHLALPLRPTRPAWELILLSPDATTPDKIPLTRAALAQCGPSNQNLADRVRELAESAPELREDADAALARIFPATEPPEAPTELNQLVQTPPPPINPPPAPPANPTTNVKPALHPPPEKVPPPPLTRKTPLSADDPDFNNSVITLLDQSPNILLEILRSPQKRNQRLHSTLSNALKQPEMAPYIARSELALTFLRYLNNAQQHAVIINLFETESSQAPLALERVNQDNIALEIKIQHLLKRAGYSQESASYLPAIATQVLSGAPHAVHYHRILHALNPEQTVQTAAVLALWAQDPEAAKAHAGMVDPMRVAFLAPAEFAVAADELITYLKPSGWIRANATIILSPHLRASEIEKRVPLIAHNGLELAVQINYQLAFQMWIAPNQLPSKIIEMTTEARRFNRYLSHSSTTPKPSPPKPPSARPPKNGFIADLESTDPAIRERSLRRIIQSPPSAPPATVVLSTLHRRLGDSRIPQQEKLHLIQAIGAYGKVAEPIASALIKQLHNAPPPPSPIVERTIITLESIRGTTFLQQIAANQSFSIWVRAYALAPTKAIAHKSGTARQFIKELNFDQELEDLARSARTASPRNRSKQLRQLRACGPHALPALPELVKFIDYGRQPSDLKHCLEAIGAMGPAASTKAKPAVVNLVTETSDPAVRLAALYCLKNISATFELIRILNSDKQTTPMRQQAAEALAAIHPRPFEATDAFNRMSNDPNANLPAELVQTIRWCAASQRWQKRSGTVLWGTPESIQQRTASTIRLRTAGGRRVVLLDPKSLTSQDAKRARIFAQQWRYKNNK